jgi:hypothetical protein
VAPLIGKDHGKIKIPLPRCNLPNSYIEAEFSVVEFKEESIEDMYEKKIQAIKQQTKNMEDQVIKMKMQNDEIRK